MIKKLFLLVLIISVTPIILAQYQWSSEHVYYGAGGKLTYLPDSLGNIIPDFSHVGYHYGDHPIPDIPVVVEVNPVEGDDGASIQAAIESLYGLTPDENGFRGAVLLKKGTYQVAGSLLISQSGIVLRGEGDSENGTMIIATGTSRRNLIRIGSGASLSLNQASKTRINEPYVPVGRKYVIVENAAAFEAGDHIAIHRPGTDNWISDLKMDQITPGDGIVQWTASSFTFNFERIITRVSGDTLFFRNPVVMSMEDNYGGGFVFKSSMNRINHVGVEDLYLVSEYASDTDEEHSWNAVWFYNAEHSWARRITSRYFAYSCVTVGRAARHISVLDSRCLDPKSIITGGRRYSFNLEGQLSLFKNCRTSGGRHDYVSSSRVCGPNVFTQSTAVNTHSDIGPHHRWAMGSLFDSIVSTGQINVQDRDNSGTGHGWAGVNQVFWNSTGSGSVCQSPWVTGKNYNIGFKGNKLPGQWKPDRPDGVWEGQNVPGLFPSSLYEAQLRERMENTVYFGVLSSLKQLTNNSYELTFNLPVNQDDALNKSKYSISGTANAGSLDWQLQLADDSRVVITFSEMEILGHFATILVTVEGIKSADDRELNGLKYSTYTEPDKRPRVSSVYQDVTNGQGEFVVASSSKTGKLYLIMNGEPTGSVADLELAVEAKKGAFTTVTFPNADVAIITKDLLTGLYYFFALDEDGRISPPSANVVYVREAPTSVYQPVPWYQGFLVLGYNGRLQVIPAEAGKIYSVEIFNVQGKMLFKKGEISGTKEIQIPTGNQLLIVRCISGNQILVKKIWAD